MEVKLFSGDKRRHYIPYYIGGDNCRHYIIRIGGDLYVATIYYSLVATIVATISQWFGGDNSRHYIPYYIIS